MGKLFFLALIVFLSSGYGSENPSLNDGDFCLKRFNQKDFNSSPIPHYVLGTKEEKIYVFNSAQLETSAAGFGGRVDLAIFVCPKQYIREVEIINSRETLAYLKKVEPWLKQFQGKPVSDFSGPDLPVDTLTHATYTSAAVLEGLGDSAVLISSSFFGQKTKKESRRKPAKAGEALSLVFLAISAIVLFKKNRSQKLRLWHLFFVVLLLGFSFNLQFSFYHITSIFRLNFPFFGYPALFLLMFMPFLLAVFCGRFYCGWLCPFGALQELFSEAGLTKKVTKKIEFKLKWPKYIFLGFLLYFLFLGKYPPHFFDPLERAFVFSFFFSRDAFWLWLILLLSLFYSRFWCRYFCPTGAFLSLFNKIALLPVFKKKFALCPWQVKKPRDLSCFLCNRCLMQRTSSKKESKKGSKAY